MSTLKDADDNENYYSGELSKIGRHLGFVGLGVIWIFKTTANKIPEEFLPATACFVVFFALDFLHYAVGYAVWMGYKQSLERSQRFLKPDGTLDREKREDFPDWPYAILLVPFVLKQITVIAGYVLLLWHFLPEAWDAWWSN